MILIKPFNHKININHINHKNLLHLRSISHQKNEKRIL